MPLRFTPLEYILSRLNLLPMPLFDTPLASGIARVLITACEMELFDHLSTDALSLEQLAEKVACPPQGLTLLLHPLVSAGYLRYRRGTYANTRLAQRWLTSSSPHNIAPYIIHSQDIAAMWEHLPEAVRTNAPVIRMPYEEDASKPETRQLLARHYAALAALAIALGGEIVKRVHLPANTARLLDVGGSHAGYSALFCRKYPQLHATILDIPSGLSAGERTAKQMHLEERMTFVQGNIVADDFPSLFSQPFDVALYFHIAHLFPPEINRAILTKVIQTLKPGGMLIFVDQVVDQTHRSHLASLIIQSMHMTMSIVGGTCYSFPTIKTWLTETAMKEVRHYRLLMPGVTLITAIK